MKFRDILRALKIPHHPNRPVYWLAYFQEILYPFEAARARGDVQGVLIMGAIIIFAPFLMGFAMIAAAFTTNARISNAEIAARPYYMEQIVLFIQMNHLQSLTEAIEANPDLLYLCHKKKSLLYWCKHYNNTKAHMVILQMIKKYPKENDKIAS